MFLLLLLLLLILVPELLLLLLLLLRTAAIAAFVKARMYGWMPHNASFGFLDIARPTLGQIRF